MENSQKPFQETCKSTIVFENRNLGGGAAVGASLLTERLPDSSKTTLRSLTAISTF